ncbi:MAG TPA: integrase [Rhodopirellula baltica]|nr:site-specific integrase [Rhodopirellula baltica]HBE62277.1 integrase [Rhodopirellula baltica]
MPKLTQALPQYRKHSSGQARVTINGRDYLLGPYGTKASRTMYDRVIAEYLASGRSSSFGVRDSSITLAMLMVDYARFAKAYYGTGKNSEWHRIKYAIRPIKSYYASLPACEFGPSHFKVVRESMINDGWARTNINANMKRIVRMMKWAAAEGKLPASVFETLRLIPGLKKGRTEARESEPVQPVDPIVVQKTLPHLPDVVADMVRIQELAGCRPGEVCKLTPSMIDRSGEVWLASIEDHKTAHHGHRRSFPLGPKAQAILLPYLDRGPNECLFRPVDTDKRRRAAASRARTTPKSCGNRKGTNRKRNPKRKPGVAYTTSTYGKAIGRAAKKAKVDHWSPNQLRHSRATVIRKEFGLEAAQVVLGHKSADITQTYAERDAALAFEVARKIG